MCVIMAKYFPNVGWVGVKNRDRNYIPEISFRTGTSKGVEHLLMWDDITQYNEGMNDAGVCIISASLMVLDDEKEITKRSKKPSKDGIKIKKALGYGNIKAAAMSLIKDKLPGNTLIFDQKTCYLLEGCWEPGGYADKKYAYKIKEVPHDHVAVRTNHGIWLDWAGYQRDPEDEPNTLSRISSESRLKISEFVADEAKDPSEMIDMLAKTYVTNPQLNCLRTAHKNKQMRTTSQIMLIPSERTMFIRPVQSNIKFDFWKLNTPKSKLWLEVLSNRVLYKDVKADEEPPLDDLVHSLD
jgi:hypothetical protein